MRRQNERLNPWRWMLIGFVAIAASAFGQPADGAPSPDVWRAMSTVSRHVPAPGAGHPGNVFLEGESVSVPAPEGLPEGVARWRVLDDKGTAVAEGAFDGNNKTVNAGTLGIGWYRVEYVDGGGNVAGYTTAAVLAKLAEPIPQDSPVCIDSASSWFARNNAARQERFAQLAALAGVNWIRDRMTWGEVETARGTFAEKTSYDTSADAQVKHGLKTLQVFHSTPGWAANAELDGEEARNRFPRDLRDAYNFGKAMAQRYRGRVQAWEPWNEANIPGFGGHTIDEMCTLQKASYLGFKAGDPDLVVCWNVFAGTGNALQTEGVLLNEAWPYFDTYNIHSYDRPNHYLRSFEGAREAASGRPIWISECGVRLPYEKEDAWGEMSAEDETRQADFIAQSYASSLYAGVNRHFFFILGNYLERGIQFGLLRRDDTPRPGYVALAAVGRLLAGARPLGRLAAPEESGVCVYAFRARPDGQERDVLVAWAEKETDWSSGASLQVTAVYDYLGRAMEAALPARLNGDACFVLLPPGESAKLNLEAPPARAAYREGAASPVVLQVQMPQAAVRLSKQAYEIEPQRDVDVPLYAYNFGDEPVTGTLAVEQLPEGWTATVSAAVSLEPGAQQRVPLSVRMKQGRDAVKGGWVKLRGDFGAAGKPVLAFRLFGSADRMEPAVKKEIATARDGARWEDNIVGGAAMSHRDAEAGGFEFVMEFAEGDPWAYPRLRLGADEIPDNSLDGLALTFEWLEGKGQASVQFIEEGGAAYLASLLVRDDVKGAQRAVAVFEEATWGSYSAPDPDGELQPEKIRTVLVGINSERNSKVRIRVGNLAWVRF